MKAQDIMTTDVVTIGEKATVREAIQMMLRTGHHALPVLDKDGTLLGMVTQLSFLRICLPKHAEQIGDLAFLPADFEPFDDRLEEVGAVPITSVMTMPPTATEETAVVELAAVITMRGAKNIPIVKDGKLVGIVGRQDVVEEIVNPHGK